MAKWLTLQLRGGRCSKEQGVSWGSRPREEGIWAVSPGNQARVAGKGQGCSKHHPVMSDAEPAGPLTKEPTRLSLSSSL